MSAPEALLSFSLGPVQPFIASARTVRDLWTGSYLLSWLTFHAMKPVLKELGEDAFVIPSLKGNSFLQWHTDWIKGKNDPNLLIASLPNRFLVHVAEGKNAQTLAQECEKACENAWEVLHQKVRSEFDESLDPLNLWKKQLKTLFEIRTVVLPVKEVTAAIGSQLFDHPGSGWSLQFDMISGLLDARRSVKHIPVYEVAQTRVPQKCSLLGTYEQLGPADLAESKDFWKEFAEQSHKRGTKTSPKERLCALSLVKRFAWPRYFSELFRRDIKQLSFDDTATAAAALWLKDNHFDWKMVDRTRWSGQWLHWTRRDQDKEDECPEDVWRYIQSIKSKANEKPPLYYAILMLDGDRMGKIMREAKDKDQCKAFSLILNHFAKQVRDIVKKHGGKLIYAGGDDVLAILPTRTALACAEELNALYRTEWAGSPPADRATLSGGIVVAHYKEDLRFAMNEARRAEKAAKDSGRDALTLAVLRRSGEHTDAQVGWDQVHDLQKLVTCFVNKFSDRWAYKLRSELPTLLGDKGKEAPGPMVWERFQAEIHRLLKRVEARGDVRDEVQSLVTGLLANFYQWSQGQWTERKKSLKPELVERGFLPDAMTDFVTLVQSASFLARGREE